MSEIMQSLQALRDRQRWGPFNGCVQGFFCLSLHDLSVPGFTRLLDEFCDIQVVTSLWIEERCVCVYVCLYTCLYIHTCTRVCLHVCPCLPVRGELCACVPVDKYVFVNTFACGVGEYTCLYLHVCNCVQTYFPASKAQMSVADLPRQIQAWGLRSQWSRVSGRMGRCGWSRAECRTWGSLPDSRFGGLGSFTLVGAWTVALPLAAL